MMHQPVDPVKVSIVYQQHQRKRQPEIQLPMQADVFIKRGCFSDGFMTQKKPGNKGKQKHGAERKENLPLVIFA